MTGLSSCVYAGTVVHKRLAPKPHAFAYSVFALALDVDEIDILAAHLTWFSRNRTNLLSFHDADLGAGSNDPVGVQVRALLHEAGLADCAARITLLCYPRMLGFVFNPLSVYFCYRASGDLGALIYEVSNTFRERKCYIIPVEDDAAARLAAPGVVAQACAKEMYVSPFTAPDGRYDFHVVAPGARVVVGITLRGADGPTLKTHFRGARLELSDAAILRLMVSYPLMTLKVVAGIHLEAARLWRKGIPLVDRHRSPAYSFTVVRPHARDAAHAYR